MNKKSLKILVLIVVIALVGGGAYWYISTAQERAMRKAIDNGEAIAVMASGSSVMENEQKNVTWIELEQLSTYNDSFRPGFDEQFNIHTIRTTTGLMIGKIGCIYVNPQGERDGNTSLKDSFRSKPFMTVYWPDPAVRNELQKLVNGIYTDAVELNQNDALLAAVNAYYNLLNDSVDPTTFNANSPLSREEFYTLVFKAENGVHPLDENLVAAYEAVAGKTDYSHFASQVSEKGWLPVSNGSLDGTNAAGEITRLEAVYMVVNMMFPEEIGKVLESEGKVTE